MNSFFMPTICGSSFCGFLFASSIVVDQEKKLFQFFEFIHVDIITCGEHGIKHKIHIYLGFYGFYELFAEGQFKFLWGVLGGRCFFQKEPP